MAVKSIKRDILQNPWGIQQQRQNASRLDQQGHTSGSSSTNDTGAHGVGSSHAANRRRRLVTRVVLAAAGLVGGRNSRSSGQSDSNSGELHWDCGQKDKMCKWMKNRKMEGKRGLYSLTVWDKAGRSVWGSPFVR